VDTLDLGSSGSGGFAPLFDGMWQDFDHMWQRDVVENNSRSCAK
jgi:hypothetical protein